ncbi:hypothetical protein [Streptomyces sp. NPDC004658]|uniref:hypothetical protein n=1 Tax=Streptomyces sp. NPDC004658 TaxID=3154672 RepID=UPI0033BEE596
MSPKITVYGGPSVAGVSAIGGAWSNEDDADEWHSPGELGGGDEPAVADSAPAEEQPSEKPRPARTRTAKKTRE